VVIQDAVDTAQYTTVFIPVWCGVFYFLSMHIANMFAFFYLFIWD